MHRLKPVQALAALSAQKCAPLQQSMLGFPPTRHYGEALNPMPPNPPDAMECDKFTGDCLSKDTIEHEHDVEEKIKKHHDQPLSRPVDLDVEFDRPMQPTSMEEVWRDREPSQRQPGPHVVVDLDPEFDRDDPEAVNMKTLYPDECKEEEKGRKGEKELEDECERMEEEGGVVVEKK